MMMKLKRGRMRKHVYYRDFHLAGLEAGKGDAEDREVEVGKSIRALREQYGFTLRSLSEKSGVSVNTLNLIENGKSSPSVSTLQKIAYALQVPLVAFFLPEKTSKKIYYTNNGQRKQAPFDHGVMEDLGGGLSGGAYEPLLVSLEPWAKSGNEPIQHSGYEFVFCLAGRISYTVEEERFILEQGDSLFFDSQLPHSWQNLAAEPSIIILVLCEGRQDKWLLDHHFYSD
jgi:transcriptional regulator with XRE-family HTH domain